MPVPHKQRAGLEIEACARGGNPAWIRGVWSGRKGRNGWNLPRVIVLSQRSPYQKLSSPPGSTRQTHSPLWSRFLQPGSALSSGTYPMIQGQIHPSTLKVGPKFLASLPFPWCSSLLLDPAEGLSLLCSNYPHLTYSWRLSSMPITSAKHPLPTPIMVITLGSYVSAAHLVPVFFINPVYMFTFHLDCKLLRDKTLSLCFSQRLVEIQ